MSESVSDRLAEVKKNIEACAEKCGRTGEVSLICVSKTKPSEMIIEAYNTGERNFGENYVQELCAKAEELPKDIIWHMIGPLQKNKVRKVVKYAEYIHAVDSLELAAFIDKEAERIGKVQKIMLELNMAAEESKHGFKPEDALDAAVKISELKNISLVGLMCIPPLANEPEDNREFFRGLREYKDKINSLGIDGLKLTELSMGMTNDYECAIEEGASYIRIGTAIFGARDYSAKQ
ncbi:MAG: YggS family pyridoxal phosphate-dependent enzyme [Lachnospiraceae bacterium]|nr:YggS family pyridoxal phosphate-dependent enzyme [Lachnospiraceae bacterium]